MSEFKVGQRVRVEYLYEGEILSAGETTLSLRVDGLSKGYARMVNIAAPGIIVTVLDPAGWPPQIGDLWEADGKEWFARYDEYGNHSRIVLTPESGQWTDPDELKNLNPVLIRRRGQ